MTDRGAGPTAAGEVDEVAALLARHGFFSDVPEPLVRRVARCGRRIRFAAGEWLLREGGEARELFLLCGGRVVLEVNVPGAGPTRMEALEDGDILGLSWLHPPRRWRLDARAVDAGEAVVIDAACLRARMDEDPALGYAIAMRLLDHVVRRLEHVRLQRLDVYARET